MEQTTYSSEIIINNSRVFHEKSLEKKLIDYLTQQEINKTIYWEKFDPFVDLRMKWRASMMRHLFHILPGQRILEIGAGNGEFALALAAVTRNECEITAIVFSREYRDSIKEKLNGGNIKVKLQSSFPGSLLDDKFDYIIAQHMLENNTRNTFLYTIKSLIKPGGGLLLFEPNPWNPYYQLRKIIRKLIPISWKRPTEPISLDRFLTFSALSEIGYTKINILPYDFLYSPIPTFLLWPAQHLSIIMENTPYLRNFAGSLYIWARNPEPENFKEPSVDLSDHQMFFGKVSFVIPCHNEEMNIPPLVQQLKDFYNKYIMEIIIVDDNSNDRTSEVTKELIELDGRIHLIRRQPPNGVGRALRDGLKEVRGDYIVIMDSDFQHIIPEMRDLFDAIASGADVAIGSRFSRSSVLVNYAFSKILANRTFHILANLLLGKRFRDISNNLKIFRREVVEKLIIESDDFAANVETGLNPLLLGYKVVEVPISWINRTVDMGLSTFKILKTGPNYFKLLIKLTWRRMSGQLNK